ncbi:MAG: hypothetical protein IKE27_00910 [Oscillospiraceae bacterium]|nr:hypothetical protein [Oscillospiraceae bacterium]
MRNIDGKDDDGRVIADMSGVEKPLLFGFLSPSFHRSKKEEPTPVNPGREPTVDIPPEDRKYYILGALKAALLIGLVFVVGLGLVILAMVLFWTR